MEKGRNLLGLIVLALALSGCDSKLPDTSLTAAAALGHAEEVQTLLDQGYDPNEKESHGWTALMCAARRGHTRAIQALLDAGANPDLRDGYVNGWTALMHAIHTHQSEAAHTLLARGADVNATTKDGGTALIMAAGNGDVEMVQALLAKGADPYAETSQGVTALVIAVSGGAFSDIDRPLLGGCQTEVVKAILQKAPDLTLKNNFAGRYARFFVRLKGCSEIIKLVEQRRIRRSPEIEPRRQAN